MRQKISVIICGTIIVFIDETWKNVLRFLPEGPYKRAPIRFWTSSVHKQVCEKFMFEFFEFMPLRIVNIKWLFGFLLLEILNNIYNKRVGN